jgi:DNA ligase-associated metallophosphoesterase
VKSSTQRASRALVAEGIWLDGRLALFHEHERWLAVADLHFGYELSQREAGNLFPMWGMQTLEERLRDLLGDYGPVRLVLLGDLVHNRAGEKVFAQLLERLHNHCEIVLIAGNHDRYMRGFDLVETWSSDGFVFHHGHCESPKTKQIQIVGHHHPATVMRDGAGLRLKLPAFVQRERCWIMPAFSPWAAGTEWTVEEGSRIWACSPQRVMCVS